MRLNPFWISPLFFLSLAAAAQPLQKVPGADYCKAQAIRHIQLLFGSAAQVQSIYTVSADSSSLWIKTSLCDGYFVAEVQRNATCGSANYGFAPAYIRRVWAFGACRALLPSDSYPRQAE